MNTHIKRAWVNAMCSSDYMVRSCRLKSISSWFWAQNIALSLNLDEI